MLENPPTSIQDKVGVSRLIDLIDRKYIRDDVFTYLVRYNADIHGLEFMKYRRDDLDQVGMEWRSYVQLLHGLESERAKREEARKEALRLLTRLAEEALED